MASERKYPLDEFFRSTAPAGKGSKLIDFFPEIETARAKKYTLSQICEWLARNDISVTIQGLSKFIRAQEAKRQAELELQSKSPSKPSAITSIPCANKSPSNPLKKIEGARGADSFSPIPKPVEIEKD
ncbi:hypothetical protein [Ralstonia solanacearum]|uniref:hypothetical protein n=1 Tax=Ralstonia solanacearum TaxID=305 RepID=UPI0013C37440|nr:hypothetical protein [Ralstonia solanacearum]